MNYVNTFVSWPMVLTLFRLSIAPFIIPRLLVYAHATHVTTLQLFVIFLFIVTMLTDFFDGFCARICQQQTVAGKVLDSIADKFFLFSMLIALVIINKLALNIALFLIYRECLVTAIRLIALEYQCSLKVSKIAKWKTVLLSTYIVLVLLEPMMKQYVAFWNSITFVCLMIAIIVSVYSLVEYGIIAYHMIQKKV